MARLSFSSLMDCCVKLTCGNCRGRSSSLCKIMQIVTSAVRIDVALPRSLFASAKFVFMWNIGRFSSTLMHGALCAAGACSPSEPWRLDSSLLRGRDDGFQWLFLRPPPT